MNGSLISLVSLRTYELVTSARCSETLLASNIQEFVQLPAQTLYLRNRVKGEKKNLPLFPKTFHFFCLDNNCIDILSLTHYGFDDWLFFLDSGKRDQ